MDQTEIRVQLPEDIAALLGATDEAASREAQRTIVLDLLRQGKISQGTAARVLQVTLHEVIDLMAAHDILSGPSTTAELRQDIANALAAAPPASTR